MASEGPPPPYNTSYQPDAPPQPPPNSAPYPNQPTYPPTAPPSYSASQEQPKAYPAQTGAAAPYPQQPGYGLPGYGPPGYPPQGAAPGYTTQAVGVSYPTHAQTTVITQQPAHGAVIIHGLAPPPDYMIVSIIGTLCCFCIGIFALVKSLRSRELYRAGDHAGAQEMGLRAKKLANVAIFVAICIYVFIVVMRIVLSLTLSSR